MIIKKGKRAMQINVLHMAHFVVRYGVERQILEYLTHIKETPNEIRSHVCALRISASMRRELEDLGIPFIVTRLWPWNVGELRDFVKKYHIHILHVHNQLRFPLRSRILPKLAGIPMILEHEHGMVWNTTATRLIKLTNSLVDANICNSNAAKIMLKQKCGIDAKVIYNSVPMPSEPPETDYQLRKQLGLAEGTPIAGFVGRLNNPKGPESFIRMIPMVRQALPKAKFIIVGDGPMHDCLENDVKKLGVEEQVYFLGYQKNVHYLLQQMDVVVVPSFREAFGNVVIEAAFAKKPVVASNVDGIAETVVDGETGFLVDCTEPVTPRLKGTNRLPKMVVDGRAKELRPPFLPNTKMLAEKVITCLQNPELAVSLGKKGYLRAKRMFTFERYRTELENVYRELVAKHYR
jgi:glycosyltransferase involved in cell wall biosynthesis